MVSCESTHYVIAFEELSFIRNWKIFEMTTIRKTQADKRKFKLAEIRGKRTDNRKFELATNNIENAN